MVIYCWRDGTLGLAKEVPAGAMEFARGGRDALADVLRRVSGDGAEGGHATLAGMGMDLDEGAALDVMRRHARDLAGSGIRARTNADADLRFVGQD